MSTSSSHQSSIEDTANHTLETKKYILLKDSLAKTRRGVNSTGKLKLISRHEEQRVLKGSLWEEREFHSPNHSLSSFSSSGSKSTIGGGAGGSRSVSSVAGGNLNALSLSHAPRKLELDSIEYDEVRLVTQDNNVNELTEQQCRLLLAIPDCDERYKVHIDSDHMSTATLINVHSRVIVSTRKLEPCKAIVRWKGRIAGKQGISFGVEIQDPAKFGCGDSDGSFNSVRLFTCDSNNGIFVNISNLKLIPPLRPERKTRRAHTTHKLTNGNKSSDISRSSDISSIEEEVDIGEGEYEYGEGERVELYPVSAPQISDRVVWIGETGYERATVKWIGTLPPDDDGNVQDGEVLVGVEFDNAVGKGTGFYQKRRLFHAQKGHASLVPLVGLYRDPQDDTTPSYRTPSPPPQFGDPVSLTDEVNADHILRDLALLDTIDSSPSHNNNNNHTGATTTHPTTATILTTANNNNTIVTKPKPPPLPPKKADKPTGFSMSPKRILNGLGIKSQRQTKTNSSTVCEPSIDSATSSNDSLNHKTNVSPRRTLPPETLSPRHRVNNGGKNPNNQGLLVPVSNHRPSSVGSISPRSCDASSQGSDTHSSPCRSNQSLLYHATNNHYDPVSNLNHYAPESNLNNNSNHHKQSANYNIIQTSPSHSQRTRHDLTNSHQRQQHADRQHDVIEADVTDVCMMRSVCRLTPTSTDVCEGMPITVDSQPGVVKWIGYELSKPGRYFAGVKMREPNGSCSNGWYGDELLVKSSRNDIMFVNLRKCQATEASENSNNVPSSPSSKSTSCSIPLIEGLIKPSYHTVLHLVGDWKGIQGDRNSCYMDACLYAMFSFSTVFDELLLSTQTSKYTEIQNILRSTIVNPLRKTGLVVKEAMYRLRKRLDDLGLVKGLRRDEKDPEEFINLVLDGMFKVPPPFELSNGQSCHTFHLLAEKDARIAFPTVQQLLEHSCAQQQLKFKQAPPYLLLHMPRFGKDFRMYDKILPTLELDITDVLQGAPRSCYVCGEYAVWECPECYSTENEWKKSTFCHDCSNAVHKHDKRAGHMPINLRLLYEMGDSTSSLQMDEAPITMKLFSVICIETSHYVTFTRTSLCQDAKWLFFDSMANRKESQTIPAVYPVEDVNFWLSKMGFESMAKDYAAVPSHIKRLVSDGYIYFYCRDESVS